MRTMFQKQDGSRPEGQLWLQRDSRSPSHSTWDHSNGSCDGSNSGLLCCTAELLQAPGLLEQLKQTGVLLGQLVHEMQQR